MGRKLNYPDTDALVIDAPRSKGADEVVAAVVEDAKKFVAHLKPGPGKKTSAAASQVRCERNTDVRIAHELPTHTARFAQSNIIW